jgi:hypothetical protein
LTAGRSAAYGTRAAIKSCSNQGLPRSRPVSRILFAETICAARKLPLLQESLGSSCS